MKRSGFFQLAVAATLLVSTLAQESTTVAEAEDATTLSHSKVTEETPACAQLNISYSSFGYKPAKEFGDVAQDAPGVTENPTDAACPDLPKRNTGSQHDWWKILSEMGGEPGTLKGTAGTPDDSPLANPCDRPLNINDGEKYLYQYDASDFKTYYRHEVVYPRFQGSPKAFNDIRGDLIWSPPASANDTRVYSVSYASDDTGSWVIVHDKDCAFNVVNKSIVCFALEICNCFNGHVNCFSPYGVSELLLASLVGR